MKKNELKPRLLLQACCAPCLTAVYADLKDEFDVTVYWFNPNVYPAEEHEKRLQALREFCNKFEIPLIEDDKYQEESFSWTKIAEPYASQPEGGKRCDRCIKYRLLKTAELAKGKQFEYFATTLSVSPHKNTDQINKIGREIADKLEIHFLDRDFKDNNGYQRSIKYCKELNIYRQNYCGCIYSTKN